MLRRKLLSQHGLFTATQALTVRNLQTCASSPLILPKIIFAENHEEDATPTTLNEMVPFLYQSGYRDFYDEAPMNISLKSRMMGVGASCQIYAELKKNMAAENLDVDQEKHVKQFLFRSYMEENRPVPKELVSTYMFFGRIIRGQDSLRSYLQFYKSLEKSGFRYTGVDCHEDIVTTPLEDVHAKRDKHMAEAYLRARRPVIGRVGLSHVQGMQAAMAGTDSLENLAARFSFIYLYSKLATSKLDNLEQRVREGKLPLHWGMHAIDCSKTSKENVVAQIQEIIEERREDLQALARRAYRF